MKLSLFLAVLLSCLFLASAATSYTQAQLTANDLLVVKYALFLERLEKAFYDYGQTTFTTDAAFTAIGLPQTTRAYFELIRAHETAHVSALESAITTPVAQGGFGDTLPAACTFNFASVNTVALYVSTARTLENLGTYAYIGASNGISARGLLQTAATITTIEARHAAYLNNITANLPAFAPAQIPFPNERDNITTPAQVAAAVQATGFANACTLPTLPAVLQTSFDFAALLFPNNTYVPGTSAQQQAVVDGNEVDALQYALFLERLEAAFYVELLTRFNDAAFSGYAPFVRQYITIIGAHETGHVNFLQTALGAAALPACQFTWTSIGNDLASWLATARTFENVGVTAYDGTIGSFITRGLAQTAATIATVEARHAAFLDELTGNTPVPAANVSFDATRTPAQVAALITPYLNCAPAAQLTRLPVIYSVQATTGATTGATSGATTGTVATTGATTARGATTNAVTTSTSASSAVAVSVAMLVACLVAVIMM